MTNLPNLPPRDADSHKGTYGRAVLVGGSLGMTGAISLAGMSALRSGAGLVTLAVPADCLQTVASFEPSYMTFPLTMDEQDWINQLTTLTAHANSVACGPGFGRETINQQIVRWMYESLSTPLIVDADGLFAIAQHSGSLSNHAGPRILTPHEGEFKRFLNRSRNNGELSREQLEQEATSLAAKHDVIVVLKGPRTLITDGTKTVRNTTGNPGMATGGSGDVLTGIIAALVGQGLPPFDAAHLGCHIHGVAGDLAAEKLGQVSMIASDLIDFLPSAFQRLI